MKPHVVILSAFLSPFRSGAEACAEEVPLVLIDDYDFTIVTARLSRSLPKRDVLRGKIPVRRIGLGMKCDKWLYPFLAPFAVRKIVTSDSPIIIHAILETFAGLALYFCRFLSAKRILTLQTTNRSFLKGMIVRSPHIVTAISTALKQIATDLGRTDVTVIPNGIPFHAIEDACLTHEKISGHILFVGRLETWKGVSTLLRAFSLVSKECPHTHLRIVGDGSARHVLEQEMQELNLTRCVTFVGHLSSDEVLKEYAAAAIFVSLTEREALGNVFLEAQAAGCGVIGTKVQGVPDIVKDGETGILVVPGSPEEASAALRRVLSDESLRHSLAVSAKQHAKKYNWEDIAGRYAQLYGNT